MNAKLAQSDLAAELADVRARLAEADEALRAIRSGAVDGVVATGERGDQVYALSGADRAYRQLIETMSEGALTLSADGTIFYGNRRVAEMLGRPLDQVMGSALRTYLSPADQQALDAILAQAQTAPSRREINLRASDGHLVPVYLSASRLQSEGAEMVFGLVLTDLTEQRHCEQVVAAERLARLILEQAAEAVVVCDEQGRIMRASQAAQEFCDCSPLLRPFAEAFPLRTDAGDPFHLAPVLQGETLTNVDVALDWRGQELNLILNAGPLLDGQRVLGCVVSVTDITERKRAEETLRESEEKYRALFENMAAASCLDEIVYRAGKPADYRVLEVNPSYEQMAEISRSRAVGALASELYGTGNVPFLDTFAKVAETGEPASFEGYFPPVGKFVHFTVSCPARGRFSTVFTDITERKRAEDALRERERSFKEAQRVAHVGNWDRDLETGAITWSEELCRIYGVDPKAPIPGFDDLARFYVPESWARLRAAVESAVQTGAPFELDVQIDCADGKVIWATTRGEVVRDAAGQIVGTRGTVLDITERKQLEAQFRQAQKMQSVGQLTSGIAHDFNNLLTVINGTSELVLAQVKTDDPVHADVQEIRDAGERAALLTRQLLAFSRQQVLEPRVLSLNTLVAGLESLLRRLIGEDIDLVAVPTPGVDHVRADPGQIEQVITNLAVNARDAMPQGGRLTIEIENVEIDEAYAGAHGEAVPPGPYVRLTVSDTGVGMDEATRARIFEPFFTTKRPGTGTGLGLSTVYGIVKQSQGFIWVYSEAGHGSSFKIYLPQATEASAPARPVPAVVSSSGTETILLVEDNAGLRKLATRLLEPAGYTVLGAATGEEALAVLTRHDAPVHLLLTDVVMPGLSGRELAEQVARKHPAMKVLFMSGYTADTIVRHGVLEATVSLLNKPFTAAALLRKVREVLDSQASAHHVE